MSDHFPAPGFAFDDPGEVGETDGTFGHSRLIENRDGVQVIEAAHGNFTNVDPGDFITGRYYVICPPDAGKIIAHASAQNGSESNPPYEVIFSFWNNGDFENRLGGDTVSKAADSGKAVIDAYSTRFLRIGFTDNRGSGESLDWRTSFRILS